MSEQRRVPVQKQIAKSKIESRKIERQKAKILKDLGAEAFLCYVNGQLAGTPLAVTCQKIYEMDTRIRQIQGEIENMIQNPQGMAVPQGMNASMRGSRTCPYCGFKIHEKARVCRSCGADLTVTPQPAMAPTAPQPAMAPTAHITGARCARCAAPIDPYAKFCPVCGAPQGGTSAAGFTPAAGGAPGQGFPPSYQPQMPTVPPTPDTRRKPIVPFTQQGAAPVPSSPPITPTAKPYPHHPQGVQQVSPGVRSAPMPPLPAQPSSPEHTIDQPESPTHAGLPKEPPPGGPGALVDHQAAPVRNTKEATGITEEASRETVRSPGESARGGASDLCCPHCGGAIEEEDSVFCTQCGRNL